VAAMWEAYRKRLVATQVMIVVVCVLLRWIVRLDWAVVAATFVVMQIGGLAGAWYGHRLVQKIRQQQDELPLHRKR
jgi:uncharacterized membrane protein YfcA